MSINTYEEPNPFDQYLETLDEDKEMPEDEQTESIFPMDSIHTGQPARPEVIYGNRSPKLLKFLRTKYKF